MTMPRIKEILEKPDGKSKWSVARVLMDYGDGSTMEAYLTANELKARQIREKLMDMGVDPKDLDELEGLAWERGIDQAQEEG